jgi:hydrogenase maturation protease
MNESSIASRIQPSELTRSVFVIGIGSPHGDDRAGWEVIDGLSRVVPKNFVLRKAAVPHDLLDWLDVDCPTHIIDASFDRAAGVRRFKITQDAAGRLHLLAVDSTDPTDTESALKSLRSSSTHQIDLLSTLELVAALHRLPRQLALWTVSISAVEKVGDVGLETQERIDECISAISKELRYA